jgi:uncharacterized protein YbjT (DUF2867 family)
MKRVAIAGASGFVGTALIDYLLKHTNYHIVSLFRRGDLSNHSRIVNVSCDLFSLMDCEKALQNVDAAVYLVHSMLPSAKLTQGNFQDFDLIMADNFAKAAVKNGVKEIIYLGGIIPSLYELTPHLISRLEVEEVLSTIRSAGLSFTSLRSGLILGARGSSYTILSRLVKRLPMMICPKWASNLSSPIAIEDVVYAISKTLENDELKNKVYDLAGSEVMTYRQMLARTAKQMHKIRFFLNVPFFTPTLSKLWIRLVTGAPRNLVYPLITSLTANVVPDPEKQFIFPYQQKSFEQILQSIALQEKEQGKNAPNAYEYRGQTDKNEVRSVQRLHTFFRTTARSIGNIYFEWMGIKFRPFISTKRKGEIYSVNLLNTSVSLLILEHAPERSSEDRVLFYIRGGLLAKTKVGERGRLEFRTIAHSRYTMAAIHEFHPRLPWFIYRYTQALMHLLVMRSFDRYLTEKKM